MKTKNKKSDLILLGAILGIGLILACVLLLTRNAGASVVIRIDGKVEQTFPLNIDRTYTIHSANGGTNELVIQNGTANVISASCPDSLCVHMPAISYSGESIVCLPNKTVVEISGNESAQDANDVPDIIAGGMYG